MSRSNNFSVYENLDTSFVNLGALLRYLQQQGFDGRVRVVLDQYEADIELRPEEKPQVRERDTATGREAEGEAALLRILVRATEPGGRISVYSEAASSPQGSYEPEVIVQAEAEQEVEAVPRAHSGHETDWSSLLRVSAELVAAVERAAQSVGGNFDSAFRAARLGLADDYHFLDPNGGGFEYLGSEIKLGANPGPRIFVSGVCEALRRVVEKIAAGRAGAMVRERVRLEMTALMRRRRGELSEFGILPQLDRIAGTRVI